MDTLVYCEITSLSEGLTAVFAHVWLLACMHQYMITQMRLVSEVLTTMITLMRLLPSVGHHMHLHCTQCVE